MEKEKELASNRKAYFEYEILESHETGIVLVGTEVKSLRDHGGNLQDGYVRIEGEEMWLLNASIALYRFGNIHNHEERRPRKLLMHKKEIRKILKMVSEKGFTLIPLALYLKKGRVKLKIGVAKGKKSHDKRKAIQERDEKRKMDIAIKQHYS